MDMKTLLKLPIFLLFWVVVIAVKIPTALAGIIMVPILWRYRAVHLDDLPFWAIPWANPEDWTGGPQGVVGDSLPAWWIKREGNDFKAFFHYHAIRNPANGLRSYEWIDLEIEQSKVQFYTPDYYRFYEPWHFKKLENPPKTAWYFAWQDWQAGFKLVHIWSEDRYLEIKLGWRVEPRDAYEPIDPNGQRAIDGAGFATKFLPYREY